jgi:hypothetical protein
VKRNHYQKRALEVRTILSRYVLKKVMSVQRLTKPTSRSEFVRFAGYCGELDAFDVRRGFHRDGQAASCQKKDGNCYREFSLHYDGSH